MTDQSVLRLWTLTIALLVGSVFVSVAEPLLLDVARAELAYDRRSGEPVVTFVLLNPRLACSPG
jgi:hypothetical protein